MRIGFIGLGNMGSAAARNLLRAGHELWVHDVRPDAAPDLRERTTWCASPREVVDQVDVVFTMVFGPTQIADVVRGHDGLLAGSCDGRLWIDMTTSRPALMRELALEFTAAGGQAVDAPVTGSIDSCIRGDMILFVGGDDAAVARALPVLEAVGVPRRVGSYGNGYVAKLVNNQLWFIHAAAIGEAMVAAKVNGLDPDLWWEAMKGGAADSFVMQHDVPSILAGHYDPSFRLALCMKDLALVDELLATSGTRAELTRAAYARFGEATERYGEDAGEMTVCKVIEDDAGVDLRVAGRWTAPWDVRHPDDTQSPATD
jgi:3-hydroxyisobutyrate dehydrogenase-like beta-hydroxyacid dehydrogenase